MFLLFNACLWFIACFGGLVLAVGLCLYLCYLFCCCVMLCVGD